MSFSQRTKERVWQVVSGSLLIVLGLFLPWFAALAPRLNALEEHEHQRIDTEADVKLDLKEIKSDVKEIRRDLDRHFGPLSESPSH